MNLVHTRVSGAIMAETAKAEREHSISGKGKEVTAIGHGSMSVQVMHGESLLLEPQSEPLLCRQ
jgi:hypothetical protein